MRHYKLHSMFPENYYVKNFLPNKGQLFLMSFKTTFLRQVHSYIFFALVFNPLTYFLLQNSNVHGSRNGFCMIIPSTMQYYVLHTIKFFCICFKERIFYIYHIVFYFSTVMKFFFKRLCCKN